MEENLYKVVCVINEEGFELDVYFITIMALNAHINVH